MSSEPHDDVVEFVTSPELEAMLEEAKALLNDRGTMKSESNVALCRLVVRILECFITGAPRTAIPVRNAHPEDDEPRPQPSPPRRL
jgi:hypothetical protein